MPEVSCAILDISLWKSLLGAKPAPKAGSLSRLLFTLSCTGSLWSSQGGTRQPVPSGRPFHSQTLYFKSLTSSSSPGSLGDLKQGMTLTTLLLKREENYPGSYYASDLSVFSFITVTLLMIFSISVY